MAIFVGKVKSKVPHLGRAFTDVQERKQAGPQFKSVYRIQHNYIAMKFTSNVPQVAGGVSIIHKSLQSFLPPSVATVLLVDCHAYDGCPALAALEAS